MDYLYPLTRSQCFSAKTWIICITIPVVSVFTMTWIIYITSPVVSVSTMTLIIFITSPVVSGLTMTWIICITSPVVNNPHQVRSKSKGWKDKYLLKVLSASKLKDLNSIAKID
jgi:hypothetical protein